MFLFFFNRFPYPNNKTVNFEVVIYTSSPYYITFDSANSHLYWTGFGTSGKIMRCKSDGSDLSTIIDVTYPMALTFDKYNRFVILPTLYT